ncbi:MAG: YncE family protein, partial [Pyrinomonadaceae bacterium]
DNTMAIVDPAAMKVVGSVAVGEGPHEVATSADGRFAYVANYGTQQVVGSTLSVIDIAARKETKRVDLKPLVRPHGIVEANGKIYFTAEANRAVARYDPAADRVDWVMGTGQDVSHMVVVSPDRRTAYTTNIASDSVTAIPLVPTPGQPPRITHIPVGKQPEGLDLSPDGRELWAGHNGDQSLSIIDTATAKVKETVKVGGVPIRVKFTPDGRRVLITNPEDGELIVFDAATRREIKRVAVGEVPVGVLVTPDGRRAFVATMQSGKVVAVNLDDLTVAGSVETGKGPDGLGWAGK